MKPIDLKKLEADPMASALGRSGKDTITVTGYVQAADDKVIALSPDRSGTSFTEYPRSAVIAGFEDEDTGKIALVVDAAVRVRGVVTGLPNELRAIALDNSTDVCQGSSCTSWNGNAKVCCPVGETCKTSHTNAWCEKVSPPGGSSTDVSWLQNLELLRRAFGQFQ